MEIRQEIINRLSKDASPINRIYGPKMVSCVESSISKEGFDDILFCLPNVLSNIAQNEQE